LNKRFQIGPRPYRIQKHTSPTSDFLNNRTKNRNEQYFYWRSNWRSGILRALERFVVGVNISDRLGGDLTQHLMLPQVQNQVLSHRLISMGNVQEVLRVTPLNKPDSKITLASIVNPTYSITLKNALVDISTGLVKLDAGFLVDATLSHWQILMYRGGLASAFQGLRKTSSSLAGSWAILPVSNYFYHTLVEDLPRILTLNREGKIDGLLIHVSSPTWALELAEEMKLPTRMVKERSLKIEELRLATAPRGVSESDVVLIREAVGLLNAQKMHSLFLSRGQSSRGDAELEAKIFSVLEPFGFRKIDPSTLSISDQIKLFSEAKSVISLHGGALANLVWSSAGIRVLEIFNHPYRTYDFARLSRVAGHYYECIECSNGDDGMLEAITNYVESI